MELIADLHLHTIASGHAMGTLNEMTGRAKELGYCAAAITDHGPAMPGSPHRYYFSNLRQIPLLLQDGFILLKGVEANVLDTCGQLDMADEELANLDWVIASMHKVIVPEMTAEQATGAWLRIAENPHVDMIGHCEQREYPFDYDRVTKAFAQNHKVVEMNCASARTRPGNEENQKRLALCCMQNGVPIAVNSDAHSTQAMGHSAAVLQMLKSINFPKNLIINASRESLIEALKIHGVPLAP